MKKRNSKSKGKERRTTRAAQNTRQATIRQIWKQMMTGGVAGTLAGSLAFAIPHAAHDYFVPGSMMTHRVEYIEARHHHTHHDHQAYVALKPRREIRAATTMDVPAEVWQYRPTA